MASANSEGTSVNNVTLSGTSSGIGNEGPMFGQHRQTARKERTCLLILGMSGVNRFIGVYRGNIGKKKIMFRGLSCFIVFLSTTDRHTTSQWKTYGRARLFNDVDTKASR